MGRFRQAAGALLLAVGLALLTAGSAQSDGDYSFPSDPTAQLGVFPYCQCNDYRCKASPYRLRLTGVSNGTARTMKICYKFILNGCVDDNPCCKIIGDRLDKVDFEVQERCSKAVRQVTYDGAPKTFAFLTQYDTGVLSVRGIGATNGDAVGKEICIFVNATETTCTTPAGLCQRGDGTCRYTQFESSSHSCCATCLEGLNPPPPPPVSPCDCLSPLIDNHSKWRFKFSMSESIGQDVVYIFNLSVNEKATCIPVQYRPGDCCNQAMDGVSLALDPAYAGLVKYVRVYTADGKEMRPDVVQTAEAGLSITLPLMLHTTDIPVGKAYTFEIAFAQKDWADTEKMPCRQSQYEPSLPSCDYWIRGWQTAPGNPMEVLTPDEKTAGCCPEGVVSFCSEKIKGTCNPRLSDSPFRLAYVNATSPTGIRTTAVTFNVTAQTPSNPIGTPDCTRMSLQSVKLYITAEAAAKVASVTLNGLAAAYSVKKDAAGDYIDAAVPGSRPGTGIWTVNLSERFSGTDVCAYQVGQFTVCNYVLNGNNGQCCTMGDAPVTTMKLPFWTYGR
ncbi:hypothetical protein HYH03_003366 [Edaphochlamys debaryana]|uniref:Pherophorin domain-containing protein n=1 Tax=Edaphochlamys debaryana TaxID=47281 RepID=A0A835Y9N7_9CHLO|nr:hypothetical protein HYH03_003366 [Edaphochlamys debaryana]|eukprot:KAG2498618.1 hypothetical protein HYH03_003366 [Edaphochlamys debaryana]